MKPSQTHRHSFLEENGFPLLMISNLLAFATHFYLTMQHYSLKLGIATGPAICNLNTTFNCDAVAASKYSQAFGIPVALLGLIAQVILIIVTITIRFQLSENSESLKKILFIFSAFVAAVSLAMGSISTFVLGTYCLFCMAAYFLSFISLILSYQYYKNADLLAPLTQPRWAIFMIVLSPAVAWMIHSMTMSNYGFDKLTQVVQDSVHEWKSNPRFEFSKDSGLILGDPSSAKMVIVEFADFLCTHCKMASPSIDSFAQSHPNQVAVIFKTFPLDGSCNPNIEHKGNGFRCQLAALPLCLEAKSKLGWKAHHWIFDNQEKLAQSNDIEAELKDFIESSGESFEETKNCLSSDSTIELIKKMAIEGGQAKIQGTPAIFVNGKELPRGQAIPVLNGVAEETL